MGGRLGGRRQRFGRSELGVTQTVNRAKYKPVADNVLRGMVPCLGRQLHASIALRSLFG